MAKLPQTLQKENKTVKPGSVIKLIKKYVLALGSSRGLNLKLNLSTVAS